MANLRVPPRLDLSLLSSPLFFSLFIFFSLAILILLDEWVRTSSKQELDVVEGNVVSNFDEGKVVEMVDEWWQPMTSDRPVVVF